MENNLNFTKEMKEMMKEWKGRNFKGYIENSDDGFLSIVRFLIEEKAFDIKNEYVLYKYPDGDYAELTCFSCIEVDKNEPLQSHIVGGKYKENIVVEEIVNIYIIKDTEKGKLFNSGIPYDLIFETAVIIQTASCCYAFWRHLIFNTIKIAVCDDLESALKTIRSVEEIQEETQEENPYVVTVERRIEKL